MKQCSTSLLIIGCLISSSAALADNHTVSVGYAQSRIEHAYYLKGVNLQYRYENEFPVGVLVSATYMSGDDDEMDIDSFGYSYQYDKLDTKLFSIQTGPVYRINPFASIYGTIGISHIRHKETFENESIREETTDKKTNFAYGAGVIINPTNNLSVNAGYEGTKLTVFDEGDHKHSRINGFNIGVGYRF